MDLSFSININLKSLANHVGNKASQGKDALLAGSQVLSNQVDRVHDFLFGSAEKAIFTMSAISTIGVSQYKPDLLATALLSSALSIMVSAIKEDGEEDLNEEAIDLLKENHPNIKSREALIQEYANELSEIKMNLFKDRKNSRHLCDLAQTNLVMTVVSQILFDNNAIGLTTLAATFLTRSFLNLNNYLKN